MYLLVRLSVITAVVILAGCAAYNWKLPGVYRVDIQQGNVIEQSMLDQLRPGMDKSQIRYIMGSPAIIDPFHTQRWEYLYSYDDGGAFGRREQRHITLHFDKNERLARVSGDIKPGDPALRGEQLEQEPQSEAYVVPQRPKPGFLSRLFGIFGDDDDEEEVDQVRQRREQENIEVIQDPDER